MKQKSAIHAMALFYKVVNMPRAHKQADLLTAKRKRVRRAINSLKKALPTPCLKAKRAHGALTYNGLKRS